MKVLLVHPPLKFMIESILPQKVELSRGHNPPLGILYIASAIKAFGKDEVRVLDAQAEELDYNEIEKRIAEYQPQVVGITALTFTLLDALETARIAKKHGAVTVLGGPHPHIYPKETSALDGVDYIVRGEGEKNFLALLDALRDGKSRVNIEGVGYRDNGREGDCGVGTFVEPSEWGIPARELTDISRYSSVLARTFPVTTLISSRGCPYRCIFCDRPHLGRKFRASSPKQVADEIGRCIEMGIREFIFYDDNFTTDRERAIGICDEITARGYQIFFDIRARVSDLDRKLLSALKRAGCDRIHLGVESGDSEILKRLRKGITPSDAERGFKLVREFGMMTLAYFMFGAPGETYSTAENTLKLAQKLKPDYVHFSLLIPFPATELYQEGLSRGIWSSDLWADFATLPRQDFIPPVWEENLNREELKKITMNAYRRFYRNPAYLIRRLKKVRSADELIRQVKAGLKVFGF